MRVILIAVGAILAVLGTHEALVARIWKPEPHAISCAELATRGAGANSHVRLVSFHLATANALHDETPEGVWRRVWIPAFPAAEPATPSFDPSGFRVLVRTDRVKSQADLERLASEAWIEGLVSNDVDPLQRHELRRLEDRYPHTQIDRCWILDHERTLMSTLVADAIAVVGLLLLGIGLWLWYRGPVWRPDIATAVRGSSSP